MYGPAVDGAPKSSEPVVSAKEAEEMDPGQLKNRTIRIDAEALGLDDAAPAKKPPEEEKLISFFCPNCKQEIEATADMAGTPAASKAQAQAQKGKTMRIDLPDDF